MSWAAVFSDILVYILNTIEGKASSMLLEAAAILAVIDIAPAQASITIYTNLQACILRMVTELDLISGSLALNSKFQIRRCLIKIFILLDPKLISKLFWIL